VPEQARVEGAEARGCGALGVRPARSDTGRAGEAITVLEGALRQRPANREILAALATYLGERGDAKRALAYAEKLAALDPADAAAQRLVETLRRQAGG